jgi:hypothetical protein
MERAAGLAAARSISRELYYHGYTSGVKWEILWMSQFAIRRLTKSQGCGPTIGLNRRAAS